MFLIQKPIVSRFLTKLVRLYSIYKKNHYDVLNLRHNCTDKEIKDAFIKMSKEYHPDKNKDARAQEKFVKIVEAYSVLGKPSSRARYDSLSEIHTSPSNASYVYKAHATYRGNPHYGYYYEPYSQRQSQSQSQSKTSGGSKENTSDNKDNTHTSDWYYGFKGIRKLPNMQIILICLGFAGLGVIVQLYIVRTMYIIQRSKTQERSRYLAEELQKVRDAALSNGNEMQTRILLDKIVTAANPVVTTASLGQALASEKKDGGETLLTEFGVADSPDAWCDQSSRQGTKEYNMKLSFETW